jgi:hypothetical protein
MMAMGYDFSPMIARAPSRFAIAFIHARWRR